MNLPQSILSSERDELNTFQWDVIQNIRQLPTHEGSIVTVHLPIKELQAKMADLKSLPLVF